MRGDGGVAGEGRVVGVPKFHSWGECTMPTDRCTKVGILFLHINNEQPTYIENQS